MRKFWLKLLFKLVESRIRVRVIVNLSNVKQSWAIVSRDDLCRYGQVRLLRKSGLTLVNQWIEIPECSEYPAVCYLPVLVHFEVNLGDKVQLDRHCPIGDFAGFDDKTPECANCLLRGSCIMTQWKWNS